MKCAKCVQDQPLISCGNAPCMPAGDRIGGRQRQWLCSGWHTCAGRWPATRARYMSIMHAHQTTDSWCLAGARVQQPLTVLQLTVCASSIRPREGWFSIATCSHCCRRYSVIHILMSLHACACLKVEPRCSNLLAEHSLSLLQGLPSCM